MYNDFKIFLKSIIDKNDGCKSLLEEREIKFNSLQENIYDITTKYIFLKEYEFESKIIDKFIGNKNFSLLKLKNKVFSNEKIKEDNINEDRLERVFQLVIMGTYFLLNNLPDKDIYENQEICINENLFKAYLKYFQKAANTYFMYFKMAHALNIKNDEYNEILDKCYYITVSVLAKMYNCILNTYNFKDEDKLNFLDKISIDDKNRFLFKLCDREDIDYLLGKISKSEYTALKNIKNEDYGDFIHNNGVFNSNKRVIYSPEKQLSISQYLDKNPVDEFPQARKMHRHFIIHSGTTNSGKTYQSLEDLTFANKGAYLAPLRLLAIEVQEKLLSQNVHCDLLTGEEEILLNNATHVSSTVEKANFTTKYDVVVIDECQMISDRDRGGAWTNAILGIQSDVIHLCTAPSAVNLLIKLINLCGDTYEHITHERNTELLIENKPFSRLEDCKKGDALILFSKKNVLAVASALLRKGIKVSVIYGSLPYQTRKKQLERFTQGETDVVVATDAIGIGLNIPIKRVVFIDNYKFDGKIKRSLNSEEIKQIAGRAGRFGIYDVGYVNALNNLTSIKSKLNSPYSEIDKAKLTLPESIIDVEGDLSENIKIWNDITHSVDGFEKQDINRIIFILSKLKKLGYENIGNYYSYKLSTMYFQEKDSKVLDLWINYLNEYFIELKDELSRPNIENFEKNLQGLESYSKSLELYYTFSKTLNLSFDSQWIIEEKLAISEQINDALLEEIKLNENTCHSCGAELEWDTLEKVCVRCSLINAMQGKNNGIRIKIKRKK